MKTRLLSVFSVKFLSYKGHILISIYIFFEASISDKKVETISDFPNDSKKLIFKAQKAAFNFFSDTGKKPIL